MGSNFAKWPDVWSGGDNNGNCEAWCGQSWHDGNTMHGKSLLSPRPTIMLISCNCWCLWLASTLNIITTMPTWPMYWSSVRLLVVTVMCNDNPFLNETRNVEIFEQNIGWGWELHRSKNNRWPCSINALNTTLDPLNSHRVHPRKTIFIVLEKLFSIDILPMSNPPATQL